MVFSYWTLSFSGMIHVSFLSNVIWQNDLHVVSSIFGEWEHWGSTEGWVHRSSHHLRWGWCGRVHVLLRSWLSAALYCVWDGERRLPGNPLRQLSLKSGNYWNRHELFGVSVSEVNITWIFWWHFGSSCQIKYKGRGEDEGGLHSFASQREMPEAQSSDREGW